MTISRVVASAHGARAVAFRTAGALLLAVLLLLLVSPSASACDVSYHYKPSLSLGGADPHRRQACTTSTSLTGAALVDLLAISALVGAGVVAFRRGRASAGSLGGPANALSEYLRTASPGTVATGPATEAGERNADPPA